MSLAHIARSILAFIWVGFFLLIMTSLAFADDDEEQFSDAFEETGTVSAAGRFSLATRGYGELAFLFHNYGANQTGEGGSPSDRRFTFDQTRFVAVLEGEMAGGVEFEAELEIEHGGSGAALELEYEEYGEYELEIEKGGEVVLEELYLRRPFGKHLWIKAGRFYVAVGQLYSAHRPTDFCGILRPEAETVVIPGVWDEMGLELGVKLLPLRVIVQVVNGLDSTGFSSQYWIASGHQTRFEVIQARDLAAVGRVDLMLQEGILFGTSLYYGNSTGNRPKSDMAELDAPLLLLDSHLSLNRGRFRTSSAVVWGHLKDAETISEYNRRLSNELDVARTAVADQAIASWLDAGVDILPAFFRPQRLEAFLRAEYFDTMFRVGSDTFDNPRFERRILSAGLGYSWLDSALVRLAWSRRSFGSTDLRPETTVGLYTAFVF